MWLAVQLCPRRRRSGPPCRARTAPSRNTAITGGSAQPVLDRTAIKEYRHRLAQLHTEIDELEARSETRRAFEARAERGWLIAALSGANAMGDRTRRFTDDPERARIAVGKTIRRAITRIADQEAVIGGSLGSRIRTGIRCPYWPAEVQAASPARYLATAPAIGWPVCPS
jgi:hypothetical protein